MMEEELMEGLPNGVVPATTDPWLEARLTRHACQILKRIYIQSLFLICCLAVRRMRPRSCRRG